MVRQRVRIRFVKQGDLRFLGHRDVMRCFERWFRRAGVRLSMTEGFHPKPRINFLAPLALGIEGLDEVLECDLAEHTTADRLREQLAAQAPPLWRLGRIDVLGEGARKGRAQAFQYRTAIPAEHRSSLPERIDRLLRAESVPVERDRGRRPLDIRPRVDWLRLEGDVLSMRLLAVDGGEASPGHVLAALGLPEPTIRRMSIQRTTVEVQP
jgi:radical SAM-linked protein